ncbi:unnamed protein product [Heterosigma akashiwo]
MHRPLHFRLTQCFGDSSTTVVTDADILSAVEFSSDGEFLATGDHGGRIVIFQKKKGKPVGKNAEYKFLMEFQSHEQEFDYLKSLEIEEKINKIKWLRPTNNAAFLLSSNDKTVKLWKLHEKKSVHFELGEPPPNGGPAFPRAVGCEKAFTAEPRRVFANAHAYHINSISPCSDGETFLSADDLRVNIWSLAAVDRCFTVCDLKPQNMEELTEVLTAAAFHPTDGSLLLTASSRGVLRLADLRARALADGGGGGGGATRTFAAPEDPAAKSFFSEIVASCSDVRWSADGRQLFARDFLTVKVWDVRQERAPVRTVGVHDQLKGRLSELYENDAIFDKFELGLSPSGQHLATGTYGNAFKTFGAADGKEVQALEVAKNPSSAARRGAAGDGKAPALKGASRRSSVAARAGEEIDLTKKVLNLSWSPVDDVIAVAGVNKLYIYST